MTLTDSEREDAELAVKARKGHHDAFAKLVNRFESRIYNFCYQFFRCRDLAGDTTQETFLRAFRYLKQYDEKRKFSTWLYSIARNICIDEKRRLDRNKIVNSNVSSSEMLNPHEKGFHLLKPSEISSQIEERVILEQAISQLPEKYRTPVLLFYYQELPYQEIADIMGLSLSLVKIRMFRAKKMLLEILGDYPKGL